MAGKRTGKASKPKAPRDPLKTASGQPYTYLGWVRAWNATQDNSLRLQLRSTYPEFARKHHDILSQPRKPRKPRKPTQPRSHLSVRPHTYHGQSGYLISGKDTQGRKVSIFSRSQAEARRIRDDLKAGREARFDREYERERERETAPKESPKESPFAPGWRRRLAYLEMLAAGQQRQIDDGYQVTFHKQALARTKREMTQLRKKLEAAGSK